MANGVNPFVTRAELKDGKVVLTVQVYGFKAGEAVEISGEATQTNGAFATFYDIQDTPKADAGNGDGWEAGPNEYPSLEVEAVPVDADKFEEGFEEAKQITVYTRVSKVWITVLDIDKSEPGIKAWKANSGGVTVKALPRHT